MSVRSLLSCLALACLGLCLSGGCRSEEGPPNVLLIVTDDQSFDALGAAGHPFVRTPNLDRLRREGALFENAFATTSLCSPARMSLLTGRYARRHRVLSNFQELDEKTETLGTWLGRAGWDTGYFGKWHIGHEAGARAGFRTSATYAGQGVYQDCEFWVDGQVAPSQGFVDDVTTDYALRFLRRERTRPFFACLGFKATHGPRLPPARLRELYRDETLPWPENARDLPPFPTKAEYKALGRAAGVELEALRVADAWAPRNRSKVDVRQPYLDDDLIAYFQLVTAVDENVGRLLDTLDALDLAANTLVVFTTDNGYSHLSHGLRGKRSAYEESIRIPLLMRYPRAIPAGSSSDELVLNVDVVPTVLTACGVELPKKLDGQDVVPLTINELNRWRDAFLYEYFWESPIKPNIPTTLCVRTRTHKLVTYPDHPGWTELYDLQKDPGERTNLFDEPEAVEIAAQLLTRLSELDEELGPRPRRIR